MTDDDALIGGLLLFEGGGVHILAAPAVGDGHLLGPQQLCLRGNVNRRHTAPNDQNAAAHGKAGQIVSLSERGNVAGGISNAGRILTAEAKPVDTVKANAEKNRVIILT